VSTATAVVSPTFTPNPRVMVRKSVLSVVMDEAKSLEKTVGARDKERLDEYFTGLRHLEKQFDQQLTKPDPIAACHARALTAEQTDWPAIAALYEALAAQAPSPVVELNRAVAVGMAYGPAAGLALADALAATGTLDGYHLLPSVRGDLLARLGRTAEAAEQFRRAAELTRNEAERTLLLGRAVAGGLGPSVSASANANANASNPPPAGGPDTTGTAPSGR